MKFHQYVQTFRLLYPAKSLINNLRENLLSPSQSSQLVTVESFVSVQNQQLLCRHISSKSSRGKDVFTLSYLVQSCGMPLEAARATSKKIKVLSAERPDAVLAFLKNREFTKSQISNADLAFTISACPTLLNRSLENTIKPSYDFVKSILLSDTKIVNAIKRRGGLLDSGLRTVKPNIELLRESGVSGSSISILLANFPEALLQTSQEFSRVVEEVKEMGFDPKKLTFVLAVHALIGKVNKLTRERCFGVYSKWGWSKDDILTAFRKHPNCMLMSEKKISEAMDFVVNKMGRSSKMIVQCPMILFFSLENRIIPRFRVVNILQSKGLIKENWSLGSLLFPAEKQFLQRYVSRFSDEVPQLLSVYQGTLNAEEV
ncbi:hypothetical protein K2173_007239 [Erythroxylum novogranatense]|uniref:Uncharacterized protein n=1 Tax=Erythroxylum novogranatense TaxID=1862640 RepID=A0AAV8U8P1_9ROSI|nr:hypothetical protein K2173_007239 [Erythroxylum novogranatense]